MGCSLSCAAFERLSTFLQWYMASRSSSNNITHYLDNVLFVENETTGDCAALLQHFMDVTEELGLPLAHEKMEGPDLPFTT